MPLYMRRLVTSYIHTVKNAYYIHTVHVSVAYIWISEHGQGMGNLDKDIARSESLRLPHECVRKRRTEVGCAPALQTEDPEAEQADWMYTPGSPSFSKPFYLIIHLFFDVENDCLLFTQFYTPISCNLSISHLTITTDSMISTLFPGSIHPLRFKEGNSASPRPKGGPWTNKTSTFSGMAFGAITGQMQLVKLEPFPRWGWNIQENWNHHLESPAKFSIYIPLSARWIDQKT